MNTINIILCIILTAIISLIFGYGIGFNAAKKQVSDAIKGFSDLMKKEINKNEKHV